MKRFAIYLYMVLNMSSCIVNTNCIIDAVSGTDAIKQAQHYKDNINENFDFYFENGKVNYKIKENAPFNEIKVTDFNFYDKNKKEVDKDYNFFANNDYQEFCEMLSAELEKNKRYDFEILTIGVIFYKEYLEEISEIN